MIRRLTGHRPKHRLNTVRRRAFVVVCRARGFSWRVSRVLPSGGGGCQNFGVGGFPTPFPPRRVGHCGGLWVSAEGAGQGIVPVVRHLPLVVGWVGGCPIAPPPPWGWGICGSAGLPQICGGWVPQITPPPLPVVKEKHWSCCSPAPDTSAGCTAVWYARPRPVSGAGGVRRVQVPQAAAAGDQQKRRDDPRRRRDPRTVLQVRAVCGSARPASASNGRRSSAILVRPQAGPHPNTCAFT